MKFKASHSIRTLLFYVDTEWTKKLSFNDDWRDAFMTHPRLKTGAYNLKQKYWLRILPFIGRYELIVLLPSTNANNLNWNETVIHPFLQSALKWRKGKILFFIGDETKQVPERMALIKKLEVDFVASQLPLDVAQYQYSDCVTTKAISMPPALNPGVFKPVIPQSNRFIDIGVRAYEYPWYIGDRERATMLQNFLSNPSVIRKQLITDISFNPAKRFDRKGWARFLNSCKATISTEAGTSFLERDDHTRNSVNTYRKMKPTASFDEIYQRFFAEYQNPISGKCISSRHFEAIGCKTCQIMFPGRYNDILEGGQHYIELKRDLSNIDEVFEKFRDDQYRNDLIDRAYEYIQSRHTYKHRIDDFLKEI